jgi:hypothetical protein
MKIATLDLLGVNEYLSFYYFQYAIEYTGHVTSLRSNVFNGDNVSAVSDCDSGSRIRSESLQQPFRRSSSLTSKPVADRL